MGERTERRGEGLIALLLVLAAAGLLAWFSSATPRALPADAPLDRFSAGRALADIAVLATAPHPTGSPQNARVRDGLLARLRGLGLQPQVRRRETLRAWDAPRNPRTWTVEPIVARLPGRDPAAPALLVMSHYDSVPRSPGAADDMAGVTAALEVARLLKREPPPARDVLFVFTDGEEPGLIGAGALLDDPAFVRRIGFVVNLEARGGGGRALMFQTGRGDRGAERLFAAHADHPASNSLDAYLYEKMPNDTDFSVALAHGLPGLNYAPIGRPELYHTPIATPARVEPGAVQSLGDQLWAVVRPLSRGADLPQAGPDLTWFDLYGRWVVSYPPAVGWVPVALGFLLLAFAWRAQARRSGFTVGDVLAGAGQSLLALLAATVLLLLWGALSVHGYYGAMAQAKATEIATVLACLAAGFLALRVLPAPMRPLGRWTGVVALAWAISLVLQLLAPRTAWLAEWPMLAAAAALAESSARGVARSSIAGVYGALALGLLLEDWHLVILGVGLLTPAVGAALLPLALPALAPFLLRDRRVALR